MEITATPPQGEICDGTGSQFSCFGVIYLCTSFMLLPQSARLMQLSAGLIIVVDRSSFKSS